VRALTGRSTRTHKCVRSLRSHLILCAGYLHVSPHEKRVPCWRSVGSRCIRSHSLGRKVRRKCFQSASRQSWCSRALRPLGRIEPGPSVCVLGATCPNQRGLVLPAYGYRTGHAKGFHMVLALRSNLSVNTDAHGRPLPSVALIRGRRLRPR
jgi:hypothetical protein